MTERSITVTTGSAAYDIVIGDALLARAPQFLGRVLSSRRVCVVTDENVAKHYLPPLTKSLEAGGFLPTPPIILPAGEKTKNFSQLEYIADKVLGYGLDRQSAIIALGGGVTGDLAGFASSVIMRGMALVQMPTTLLAQVDSSVGGKTGINTQQGKNLIGSFHQPRLVLIDTDTLATLPSREIRAGYAEILKYALINEPLFFDWLEKNGEKVIAGDAEARTHAIAKSCAAKAEIVGEDEHEEKGIRALLNFGHTFGHAVEALGGYDGRILHGEAVAVGMRMAYAYAVEKDICPAPAAERVIAHMDKMGLMAKAPFETPADKMIEKMRGDKKAKDGRIALVLPKHIGNVYIDKRVDEADLSAFLGKAGS